MDASQEAYGCLVYIRCVYTDEGVSTGIVNSKSKVALIHAVSIPRMELMTAVLGLRLVNAVIFVTLNMTAKDCIFWSDCMDVLYWIRGCSRQFKPFVANRVGEIQTHSNPEQWRHVPTKYNPADLISIGVAVEQLITTELWWYGPGFLSLPPTEWPEMKLIQTSDANHEVRLFQAPATC